MIVAVTGHRPNKLGGYNPQGPLRQALKGAIVSKLQELQVMKAISGMALGIDQDFVDVCILLKIPFIAAAPFQGQESVWLAKAQEKYHLLLKQAEEVIYTDDCHEGLPGYATWKMQVRNEWMVQHCDHLLAIWDGTSGGTKNCVDYAEKIGKPITRINPRGSEFIKYWSI